MSSPYPAIDEKLGNDYVQPKLGRWHKNLLLSLFCLAEFIDAFSSSALFPAVPAFQKSLNLLPNELTWMFSAYSASFAAFLLISGRVSDIYSSSKSRFLHRLCGTRD